MVLAIWFMRSTSATYSSCKPGRRRERNTVTIMRGSLSSAIVPEPDWRDPMHVCDGSHPRRRWLRLLVERGDRGKIADPALPRPRPDLPPRRELVSLTDGAGPDAVGLGAGTRRGGVDRRAAAGAEG